MTMRHIVDTYSGLACGLILLGFAWAGLSPFDPTPENRVSWIDGEDGLDFRRGSLFGYRPPVPAADSPCSIELYVRLSVNRGSATLLGFYHEARPGGLRIEQSGTQALWVALDDEAGFEEMWLARAFTPGAVRLITIAGGATETRVYLDGVLAETFPRFRLTASDCSGRFVLGTGVTSDSTWSGDMFGMAFYHQTLTSADVSRNYRSWRTAGFGQADLAVAPTAIYRFDEGGGDVVHNHVTGEAEIRIPARFNVPIRTLLERPSMLDIRKNGPDWPDIAINVGGFVPFGFFLFSLLTTRHRAQRAIVLAIVGGLLVSLLIEVTQSWLPTRSSSLTDVLTNVTGSALGVLLYLRLFGSSTAAAPESSTVRP